jgi:thioredoxin-like negative regulator of GroEL
VWVASTWGAYRSLPKLLESGAELDVDSLYQQAQSEYLKGHWYEAETLLAQLLQVDGRDVDSRLMLATLYRHTERYEEAISALTTLQRLESAEKWEFEINQELHQLRRKKEQARQTEELSSQNLEPQSPTQAQPELPIDDAA